jgi:hypothetical protein
MDIINLEEYNKLKEQMEKMHAKWRENSKKYYEKNKDKVRAQYEANKEDRAVKRKANYEKNKERERIAFKTWYQNPENKAKHNAKMKENMTCECGLQILRGNLAKHRKSTIHKTTLEKSTESEPIPEYTEAEDDLRENI